MMESNRKGNPNPTIKTCWKRAVVGVNLTTGQRVKWQSVRMAADAVGFDPSWFTHLLKENRPANGWLCAYEDEEDKMKDRLDWCKRSGKYAKIKPNAAKSTKGKVALRIDSRTVIYVKPENATPEYAEEYRQRISNANRPQIEKDKVK